MPSRMPSLARSRPLFGLALATSLATAVACGDTRNGRAPQPVTVFTHNIYLGTDFTALLTATDAAAVPPLTAKLWANVKDSNYPARAKVLAAQIVEAAPDLVALQEVSLYRRQVPSDFQPGAAPNATDVDLDFLALLMNELEARGGHYVVAGAAENADVEVPVADAGGTFFDLRLTDRDVILARDDVKTSAFAQNAFSLPLIVNVANAVPLKFVRSTSHVLATVGAAQFTFANTHVEVQAAGPFHSAQVKQLPELYAGTPDPLILTGDFNTAPEDADYSVLTAKLGDAWVQAGVGTGFTCCQADDLRNATSTADQRIDHVLVRGNITTKKIEVVGTDPATGRTPEGQWPSDHFGVRAELEL